MRPQLYPEQPRQAGLVTGCLQLVLIQPLHHRRQPPISHFGGHDAASVLAPLTKDGFRVVGFSVRGMGEVDVGRAPLNVERSLRAAVQCQAEADEEMVGDSLDEESEESEEDEYF